MRAGGFGHGVSICFCEGLFWVGLTGRRTDTTDFGAFPAFETHRGQKFLNCGMLKRALACSAFQEVGLQSPAIVRFIVARGHVLFGLVHFAVGWGNTYEDSQAGILRATKVDMLLHVGA